MIKKIALTILILCFSFYPAFAKDMIEVVNDDVGVYVFKINTNKYGKNIMPYMPNFVQTPRKVFEDNPFALVVNAGFFDVRTGESVSRVIIDEETLSTIDDNNELVNTLKNNGRYENVKRRAELRILENKKGNLKFDITFADCEPIKGYKIKHSIQAGPIITPCMDLEYEGFLVYDDDKNVVFQAVDILKRRERTVVGLKGKYLYIVIFTKDKKVDAIDMKKYIENKLHLEKAMAFDGGLSTAITTNDINIGSFGKYQRRVKSFLVIKNEEQ